MISPLKYTAILTLCIGVGLLSTNATLSQSQGYENPAEPALTLVPETLTWSNEALAAAESLKSYLQSKLLSEIKLQKTKGATNLVKVYSSISPSFKTRDWKIYLKDLRPYKIKGFNSKGKLVRTSKLFPMQSNMMAASMVYLEQDKCSLTKLNLLKPDTWWTTKCSIYMPPSEKFLRTALRSWIHMTDNPPTFAQPAEEGIKDCFALGAKYSVIGSQFVCPALKTKYGLPETVDLYHLEALGGYQITVDTNLNSYKVLYLAPDFQALADLAAWDKTTHWITFSGFNY